MKILQVVFLTMFLFIVSCNMESNELTNYYNNNPEIHRQIAGDLIELSKTYRAETQVRKGMGSIVLSFYYTNNPEPKTILYDSLLNRDNYTEGASEFYCF
jgi:hypothetical protein